MKINPLIALYAVIVSGCTTISSQRQFVATASVMTTQDSVNHGQFNPESFYTDRDTIDFSVFVTWADVTKPMGIHKVIWNWYKEGKLVSSSTKDIVFEVSPFHLWSRRPALGLGKGHFRVKVSIDNIIIAERDFETL